ncbi:hypothetical protein BDR04DRAFT_1116133 [Suillus decipiens]|nr:hypothetical protein BDR04DRAFT_1116133 [Suillus decipiens]
MFVLLEASEDDNEDDDKECEEGEEQENHDGTSAQSPQIMFEGNLSKLLQGCKHNTYGETLLSGMIPSASPQLQLAKKGCISFMYKYGAHSILGTSTEYVAKCFWGHQFPVTISPWTAGQLYMVTDSFKAIADSIPVVYASTLKDCIHITEAECEIVKHSRSILPNQAWVRIRDSKYKGNIAQVFNPSLPNGFVAVLIASWNLSYSISQRSALFERSHLLNTKAVSDILCDDTGRIKVQRRKLLYGPPTEKLPP